MQTTISKWGNSQGVRIPKELLDKVNLAQNDIVEIIADDENIIIKKSKKRTNKHKTIQERFQGFDSDGAYAFDMIDWGKPEGHEIW